MPCVHVPELLASIAVDGVETRSYRVLDAIEDPGSVEFLVPTYMGPAADLSALSAMRNLQVLQLLTAGYEGVQAHLPPGVTLCNAAGVHDTSTAELALGLMIASQRGIDVFSRAMADGIWGHRRYPSLADRRVLIIGAGGLGRAIQHRLIACEAEVTMVAQTARADIHAWTELPDLLPRADIVVLAVPLTSQTRHLVDAVFLAHMATGALLVNMARGPVVDTAALTAAVLAGRVRAALDVTDPEPLPPQHPLWRAPDVLISPHVGGNSTAFLPRAERLVTDQIRRWVSGAALANIVGAGSG